MPPKGKAGTKGTQTEAKVSSTTSGKSAPPPPPAPPASINERSQLRYQLTNPLGQRVAAAGLAGLSETEHRNYIHSEVLQQTIAASASNSPFATGTPLSIKAERELWKTASKDGLPIRQLQESSIAGSNSTDGSPKYSWGKDRSGRDIGTYTIEQHSSRSSKQGRLTALSILHKAFLLDRSKKSAAGTSADAATVSAQRDEERQRRTTMSTLKSDLYGCAGGEYKSDPEWDDVVPIAVTESDKVMAQIIYPDDYSEAISYLRAIMAVNETSPRCLRLTQDIIDMNPAHYTVWLYRFQVLTALKVPIADELDWLNGVALRNLKNYQIWHHRQQLINYHYDTVIAPSSTDDGEGKLVTPDHEAVAALAKSEGEFLAKILASDSKNYHVWSYRQFLIRKLNLYDSPEELAATNLLIEQDVRNNSAWAHRFFLIFTAPQEPASTATENPQNPSSSSSSLLQTVANPNITNEIIDREVAYSQKMIERAPQNQSPWNYLKGVLRKGGKPLADAQDFASGFVDNLGSKGDGNGQEGEQVRSSHALDLLADIAEEKGDKDKAKLCWERLADRWDPIRGPFWRYKARSI